MTLLALIALVLLFSLGGNALAFYDWTTAMVAAAFIVMLMLLTRRL